MGAESGSRDWVASGRRPSETLSGDEGSSRQAQKWIVPAGLGMEHQAGPYHLRGLQVEIGALSPSSTVGKLPAGGLDGKWALGPQFPLLPLGVFIN